MDYDLVVIGAGWAGFNAAKRAKQSGLKVALVEKAQIGGTCLNRGCIPTKALIQSAKVYNLVKKSTELGIETQQPKVNFSQIQSRKDKIVQQLAKGIEFMLKGVEIITAEAHFVSNDSLDAAGRLISAKYFLLATGSRPVELKQFKFDGTKIISSDDILKLKEIPASLLIVGGGVIGCEFASLFSALGTQVSVVEKMPQLLPGEDREISRKLESVFKKKGIKVFTNTDAATFNLNDYSSVLICVGRAPVSDTLVLDKTAVKTERGKIIVDDYLKTNAANIYAAGDCTGKIMLAHFAAFQGVIAAGNMADPANMKKCCNDVVPNCIFTDPEIAGVGVKEEDARSIGMDVNVSRFDFLGSGMARIIDETEGFIKIVSDNPSGRIIGASIIGPKATELIATLTVSISNGLTVGQLKNTIFAHPTLSESIHESL